MWNFNATVMWMIRKEEAALMWKILVSAPEEELPPGFPRPVSPILYLPLCRISLPSCISNAAVSLNFSAIYSALLYFLLCCILLRCISYTAVLPSLLHCPILVPGLKNLTRYRGKHLAMLCFVLCSRASPSLWSFPKGRLPIHRQETLQCTTDRKIMIMEKDSLNHALGPPWPNLNARLKMKILSCLILSILFSYHIANAETQRGCWNVKSLIGLWHWEAVDGWWPVQWLPSQLPNHYFW